MPSPKGAKEPLFTKTVVPPNKFPFGTAHSPPTPMDAESGHAR